MAQGRVNLFDIGQKIAARGAAIGVDLAFRDRLSAHLGHAQARLMGAAGVFILGHMVFCGDLGGLLRLCQGRVV